MNLLHPHPPLPHLHFHRAFIQNKKGALLTMRCSKSEPELAFGRRRGEVAGRDRIISFGKHKGKMLGTLPSSYLKWISSNLRAGDSLEWAELADEVLKDPIYRDRIEWESALDVLNGDNLRNPNFRTPNAVSTLIDISHRFGWDNEDKVGWSKIDFELLGTSRGGRIPRLVDRDRNRREGNGGGRGGVNGGDELRRRMQRRERQRSVRLRQLHKENKNVKIDDDDDGDGGDSNRNQIQEKNEDGNVGRNRFPGREAFLHSLVARRVDK